MAATVQPLVTKNGNRLEVNCPADIGLMRADVTKVRQTLFNLLSNAAKFTHQGRIQLTAMPADRVDQISLVVEDSGEGIGADDLARRVLARHLVV